MAATHCKPKRPRAIRPRAIRPGKPTQVEPQPKPSAGLLRNPGPLSPEVRDAMRRETVAILASSQSVKDARELAKLRAQYKRMRRATEALYNKAVDEQAGTEAAG